MRNSVLLSAAAHFVIVALALVAFPSPEELPSVPPRVLPVELVTIDQVTNLKSMKKVEKPKPVEKKVEKPTPPRKEPEKKTFDPKNIAALLDKAPDTARKNDALESTEDFESPVTDDPAAAMTMSEIDAVRQRVQRCWNIRDFAGSADADKLSATIRFSLNQDGSLAGFPSVVNTSGGSLSRLFAERAIQAVQKCAPYDFLPPDKFTSWRDMRLKFNLSELL